MEPRSEDGTGSAGSLDGANTAGRPARAGGPAGAVGPGSTVPVPQLQVPPTLRSTGSLIRASDQERDDVLRGLQNAFAEGRLGDEEFDERMRVALGARTRAELGQLLADLPEAGRARQLKPVRDWPAEGPFAIAIKGSVRRSGRWRVPRRLTTFAYKGGSHLDLRAAELTAPVTAIRALGYKSDMEIIVPPGVRVVTGGFGVSRGLPDDEQDSDLPEDAPVLHVRAFTYKGRIEIRTRPRSR